MSMMMARHLLFLFGRLASVSPLRIVLAAVLCMGSMTVLGVASAAAHSAVAAVHEEHQECKSDQKKQSR
jgi:hypothetical protein